jgi:hypothetical protein
MGQENLTAKELKMLNIYLREADKYLNHLKIHDKATLLLKMESFLIGTAQKNEKNLRTILDEYGHVKSFVNYHLVEAGFKKSSKSFSWQYLLLFFLIFISSILLGSFMLFKKIKDAIKETGINLEMNDLDNNRIQVTGQDVHNHKFHFEGSKPKIDYDKINLFAKNSKIFVTSGDDFSYDCFSDDSRSIDKNFSVTNKHYDLNIDSVECNFVFPESINFKVDVENTVLEMKKLNKSFSVYALSSTITWKESDKNSYNYKLKSSSSSVVGPSSDFATEKSKFVAEFDLKQSTLNLSK